MAKQERSAITRKNIIQAGQVCFGRHGYDATGVAEICKEAQISKGAFYHHFASKQELYLQILQDWLSDLDRIIPEFVSSVGTIPEAFERMSDLVQVIFELAEGQLPVMFDFWAKSARDPELFEQTVKPLQHFEELFANYIQRGIEEGSLRDVDPEITAKVLISMVLGILLQGLLAPNDGEWNLVANQGVSWILNSIKKEK
jgi:AcrR family transcriptional regulator